MPPGILGSVGRSPNFSSRKKERFPWLLLLAVLATGYLFWGLPAQLGPRPVEVRVPKAKQLP